MSFDPQIQISTENIIQTTYGVLYRTCFSGVKIKLIDEEKELSIASDPNLPMGDNSLLMPEFNGILGGVCDVKVCVDSKGTWDASPMTQDDYDLC